jgi:uncharacterized protein (DUF1800 family)
MAEAFPPAQQDPHDSYDPYDPRDQATPSQLTPPTPPTPPTRRRQREQERAPRSVTSGPRKRPAPGLSRRNLLLSGATAVAAASGTGTLLLTGTDKTAPASSTAKLTSDSKAGASSNSAAAPAGSGQSATSTTSAKSAGFVLPKKLDPALLLSRTTYGRTAASERSLDRLGPTSWLNLQLTPAKLKDPGGVAVDRLFPRLAWSGPTARAKLKMGAWDLMQDTATAHLGRAAFSQRQLFEVMVDFWSNHLNITCPSGDVWDVRHRYQIDVIRKYALGTFEAMLLASAVHPAMLVYLNGAQSTGQSPNENYAREVLELHTVGVDGGYTERDIQKSALLLTGWNVAMSRASYDPARHYVGRVRAFGFSSANASAANGRTAQRAYLRHLAHHPKTAQHLATKLAQRFVSDDPPKSLITKLAAVYRKHDTAIVPVLQALFSSPEFAASSGEKIRRPMELAVANARVLGVRLGSTKQGLTDFYYTLSGTGHAPLGWAMPNGYADVASAWQSPAGALQDFNATTALVQGWWPTKLKLPGAAKLLANPPRTRSGVIAAVARKMLGRGPTGTESAAARKLLAGTTLPTTFAAGSYQQQQTVALVTILFLSSPKHLARG